MNYEQDSQLNPYTSEQMESADTLPEKISSISHDIDVAEGSKVEHIISEIGVTNAEVSAKTDERFCFLGSMAMYSYLHEMSGDAAKLQILEARIAGGKNDIDLAVPSGRMEKLTNDFGWSEEEVEQGHGHVGESKQMIDVMERQELPSFGWQEVSVNGEKVLLQHPVEMIFEKMMALQDAQDKEIKWGVDIKILKTYLMVKNGLSEEGVEEYLAEQFEVYKNETKRAINESDRKLLSNVQLELQAGKSKETVLCDVLEEKSGQPVEDLRSTLFDIFGDSLDYDGLMRLDDEAFISQLDSLVGSKDGIKYSYKDIAESSQRNYSELLNI